MADITADEIEAIVTRIVRKEVAELLDERVGPAPTTMPMSLPSADETLDHWAERVELSDAPTGQVVVLVNELRQRIVEFEQLHRRALDELTGDRRALIDEAVDEIRKVLLGD